ncbi:hypothetical protein MZM54_01975 [[Brevibacterium] frigoritolerans]|nr:hypothetical protein [Peribacillus frigoritolerans]
MNKKIIIIIISLLLVVGGGIGFWFMNKDSHKDDATTAEGTHTGSKWNPYGTEEHHSVTLSDQLLSAGNGEYVVKMSVTLDFKDAEGYYKYQGLNTKEEAEKAEKDGGGHGESEEAVVTPMALKINDTIGELMMKANDQQLTKRDTLKAFLKDGINRSLGFDEPVIKEIYIENFVLQ